MKTNIVHKILFLLEAEDMSSSEQREALRHALIELCRKHKSEVDEVSVRIVLTKAKEVK